MAISEFEVKRCEREIGKFLAIRRPPPYARGQYDFGYRIENQSVELFEIRPQWRNPSSTIEFLFAKATYVKKEKYWKVFWRRQDLKWHSYTPEPNVRHFERFLTIVNEDINACFFG